MGVDITTYRARIGFKCKCSVAVKKTDSELCPISCEILWILFSIVYIYVLVLLMAVHVDQVSRVYIECDGKVEYIGIYPYSINSFTSKNDFLNYINCCFFMLLTLGLNSIFRRVGSSMSSVRKYVKYKFKNFTSTEKLAVVYSCWIAIINITLIVVSNPGILNPGPDLSVLYHNCQGFIPFSERRKQILKKTNF